MDDLPNYVVVLLVVLAIALGLWLGARAGKLVAADDGDATKKTIGSRVRGAATSGVIRLWKWNRDRKKNADRKDP